MEMLFVAWRQNGEIPVGEKKMPTEVIATIFRWVALGVPKARPEWDAILTADILVISWPVVEFVGDDGWGNQ